VTTARFGAGLYGFVEWMSADARLIALRTFTRPPRISHHGEDGLHARLELVDTTTGKREQPDDLIAEDPRGRHIVVRAGKHLWLIDGETGKRDDLAARGAELESDGNACLPPRQALFDATGTHVLFIRKGPDRLVQRDLQSGVETEIAAGPGRLWAAISEGPDEHPLLIVVPKDSNGDKKISLPSQRTTCACRWCGRFAMASSSRGFDGDAFKFVAVDGARRVDVASPGIPLGADVFAEDSEGPLTRADGSPYPLPQGCQQPQVVRGSPAVLLTCDTRGGVLWPATGKHDELADPVRPLANASARRHDGRRLVGATLGTEGAAQQLVTLDLERGTSTPGPKISGVGAVDRRGHVLACDAAGIVGHDTLGGATRRLVGAAVVTGRPGLVHLGGRLHAVDGARGLAHALPEAAPARDGKNDIARRSAVPVAVAENGCVLLRAGAGDAVDVGPWTVQCPGPDPAP
jgi:hypothetical protein